ncbi:MAG: 16S rRNA (uracil(1498)-N(3))-methyltransferase [Cocleimonas sp.]
MRISRFYQDSTMKIGDTLELSVTNHRHAIQVLRLKSGDALTLFNAKGGEYAANIVSVDKRKSSVLIESYDDVNRESDLKITLAVANIKTDKMDFAIQKAVELGVNIIQPLYTKRSVIRIKANRLEKKINHWQGIIIAACEQSGRTQVPYLNEPVSLDEFINGSSNDFCIAMLPTSSETINDLKVQNSVEKITLLIGPEGGFSTEEEDMMQANSVRGIRFGKRILRAETAAIAGITACQLQWGDLLS